MWHKQSFTQFWSQSDAYSRRSSLKLTYIHHPLVVCTHQICCAVAVPIALSQDRLLHGHNRLVNWIPCSRMRESKLKISLSYIINSKITDNLAMKYDIFMQQYLATQFHVSVIYTFLADLLSVTQWYGFTGFELQVSVVMITQSRRAWSTGEAPRTPLHAKYRLLWKSAGKFSALIQHKCTIVSV